MAKQAEAAAQGHADGKVGKPVDEMTEHLLPYMEPGDLIIGGHHPAHAILAPHVSDVHRHGRCRGEEGARLGASMMSGGSVKAWGLMKDFFQAICAKTPDAEPCWDW
jgi:6-phosphogluconate dehydrogenase